MDQDPFTVSLFKWEYPRGGTALPVTVSGSAPLQPSTAPPPLPPPLPPYITRGLLGIRDPVGIMGMGIGMNMQGIAMGIPGVAAGGSSSGSGGLEELFQAYGIRYYTAAKMAEMGFTVSTLVNMKEEEVEEMMNSLSHLFRWDIFVGERYGIKAAIRAEKRRLEELEESRRHQHHHHHSVMSFSNTPPSSSTQHVHHDDLSQEGLSEEGGLHTKEVAGSGSANWEMMFNNHDPTNNNQIQQKKKHRKHQQPKNTSVPSIITPITAAKYRKLGRSGGNLGGDMVAEEADDDDEGGSGGDGGGGGRQREHPFIVTEPGEVARGKKNGLDYLFHLYEQCREFLIQVQCIAKERGEKCPTKVTNQVFRFAKKSGATYINKPKMRHYVHCYALHCLDEETSNALRKAFKERGENVGAWRLACYKPLVDIAARQGWDIDVIFNSHPRLSIWYVPTKLRQLCHAERSSSATSSSVSGAAGSGLDHHDLF